MRKLTLIAGILSLGFLKAQSPGGVTYPQICAPLDSTCFSEYEEFLNSSTSTGGIGKLGWNFRTLGGNQGTFAYKSGTAPNLGLFTSTSADATHGNNVTLDINAASLGQLSNQVWENQWIIRPNNTTGLQLRAGVYQASTTAAIPAYGSYLRFDTTLTNLASAVCNDAGNKCGLTTLSCSSTQTVTFNVTGGTATGSVACTGSNAIANGTAITVVSSGAGYNSTALPTAGVTTGGTATSFTGAIAITPTLGSASSGPDTHWNFCTSNSTFLEVCIDTTVSISTNFFKFRLRNLSATSSMYEYTLYDGTGALLAGPTTFCASGCTITATVPTSANETPGVLLLSSGAGSVSVDLDRWAFMMVGLAR